MIRLCRNNERQHIQRETHHSWYTFAPRDPPGSSAQDFGALATLNEVWLSPGRGAAPLLGDAAEIVSYLYKGALAQQDASGQTTVVQAGEFQCMTPGDGSGHEETNASRSEWAQVFRICLRPVAGQQKRPIEQRRFAAAERHNRRCVVASPDGRQGSLLLLQDALIISSVLDPGRHLIHELEPGRRAWLHLISGEALLGDLILTPGDGMGVIDEAAVSLTARESTEILIVDLGTGLSPAQRRHPDRTAPAPSPGR